jgi:transcriptional regulator with XRE-family HTH domain
MILLFCQKRAHFLRDLKESIMTILIHPAALRAHRNRKRWTQEQLADATKGPDKVSLPTIKRIENSKNGSYQANGRVAKALTKALGVNEEELSRPPSEAEDREALLKEHGYRPLRTILDAETALAFKMVHHIYGIPTQSQIQMAPLFTALLAEASLAWRREQVTQIEEASERLRGFAIGHSSYANAANRSLVGAEGERQSIEKSDIFGEHVGNEAFDFGFDPSRNNPFADFLEHLAKKVEAKTISFDKSLGWKTSEGLPEYRIGEEIIERLTDGDPDAEYALLRGHVRLKDIPHEFLDAEKKAERIAWMIATIPEEEMKRRKAERDELSPLVPDLDLSNLTQPTNEKEGNNHA